VLGFIVRRLFWAILMVAVITLITFVIFIIVPADQTSVGSRRQALENANPQTQFDLNNRSLPEQYVLYVDHVLIHGDFGYSLRQPLYVSEIITRSLPVTLSLVIGGTILWLLIAFPIGIFTALRPRSLMDKGMMALILVGVSAHPVWIGLMLSYFFGVKLNAFPVADSCNFNFDESTPERCGGPADWAHHLVLPWITFAFLFAALYARMIRATMLEQMDEDWVRTARAKGAGAYRVVKRHVLPNTLLPVVTMIGMDVALAFGGALFIETVFQLPGMGSELYRALRWYDLPVIMGITIVVAIAVTIANLIVDVAYCMIDPRVRFDTRERKARPAIFGGRVRSQPRVKESQTQAG
jgi:peptide/nickel transport system permease protein